MSQILSSRPIAAPAWPFARAASAGTVWWAMAMAAAALVTAPLLVVDVPPVLDYPNHLARSVVLAAGGSDPALARFWVPHWGVLPNLGTDILLPPLFHWLPVNVAGRLVLGLTLLVLPAGAAAYHRALFGRRDLWPLATALIACNGLFLLGFLNCLLSTGLALFVAAGFLVLRDRHPVRATALCATGSAVLFFCHLFGAMLLGILVFSHEAERLWIRRSRRRPIAAASLRSAAVLGLAMLPAAALLLCSPFASASSPAEWQPWPNKLAGLLVPVLNYDGIVDLVTAILLVGFAVRCAGLSRWAMPPSSRVAMALLLALYAACPFTAKGGAWLDGRFALAAGLMLFAGCRPAGLPPRAAVSAVLACACLLLVRTGLVASVWAEHRADLEALRASIAAVPPGARVLVVRVDPALHRAAWLAMPPSRRVDGLTTTEIHMAALLLIERRAFWPLLFADPAQQPVAVQPAFRDSAVPVGRPPEWSALLGEPTAEELREAPYLAQWRSKFDDVLVLDADAAPDLSRLVPQRLQRINDTGFAALYHVRPP